MKRELTVFLLGSEVNGGLQSTVSSMWKMKAADCTHPEASLIGSSGCRWLLHEESGRGPSGRLNGGRGGRVVALTGKQGRP
jgi:hypothetical protein